MQTITTIGLDIAKSVFQVHGVDADGQVVIRRQLKRRYVLAFFQKLPPCLVVCVPKILSALISRKNRLTSAHHDRAAVFRNGRLSRAIQVEEPA